MAGARAAQLLVACLLVAGLGATRGDEHNHKVGGGWIVLRSAPPACLAGRPPPCAPPARCLCPGAPPGPLIALVCPPRPQYQVGDTVVLWCERAVPHGDLREGEGGWGSVRGRGGGGRRGSCARRRGRSYVRTHRSPLLLTLTEAPLCSAARRVNKVGPYNNPQETCE